MYLKQTLNCSSFQKTEKANYLYFLRVRYRCNRHFGKMHMTGSMCSFCHQGWTGCYFKLFAYTTNWPLINPIVLESFCVGIILYWNHFVLESFCVGITLYIGQLLLFTVFRKSSISEMPSWCPLLFQLHMVTHVFVTCVSILFSTLERKKEKEQVMYYTWTKSTIMSKIVEDSYSKISFVSESKCQYIKLTIESLSYDHIRILSYLILSQLISSNSSICISTSGGPVVYHAVCTSSVQKLRVEHFMRFVTGENNTLLLWVFKIPLADFPISTATRHTESSCAFSSGQSRFE